MNQQIKEIIRRVMENLYKFLTYLRSIFRYSGDVKSVEMDTKKDEIKKEEEKVEKIELYPEMDEDIDEKVIEEIDFRVSDYEIKNYNDLRDYTKRYTHYLVIKANNVDSLTKAQIEFMKTDDYLNLLIDELLIYDYIAVPERSQSFFMTWHLNVMIKFDVNQSVEKLRDHYRILIESLNKYNPYCIYIKVIDKDSRNVFDYIMEEYWSNGRLFARNTVFLDYLEKKKYLVFQYNFILFKALNNISKFELSFEKYLEFVEFKEIQDILKLMDKINPLYLDENVISEKMLNNLILQYSLELIINLENLFDLRYLLRDAKYDVLHKISKEIVEQYFLVQGNSLLKYLTEDEFFEIIFRSVYMLTGFIVKQNKN